MLMKFYRCGMAQSFYDDVFNSTDDEQSKISIETIEHLTDIFTKFARNE